MVQGIGSVTKAIKIIIIIALVVMILGSSNQAIGCVHRQRNTVSHYILLIKCDPL